MSGRQQFETWTGMPLRLAELLALEADATAWVLDRTLPCAAPSRARSIVDLCAAHVGAQVLVGYEEADPARPIVLGVLRGGEQRPDGVEVQGDGERMVISARRALVLRCGEASITLTSAGKVLIEGKYLLSRSAGANRIKGGSIELN